MMKFAVSGQFSDLERERGVADFSNLQYTSGHCLVGIFNGECCVGFSIFDI